ncbi:Citrate lyase beta chain [uncultured delta proteobacterium]|uniref:Citrate lyase beta chain n=1 Tax=uncultured delta proteobacterium TaxID=34034 RepID=A0A212JC90_9DELT|nr:Citrate lyase beta chain [uncultured delta proteobacterium]
MKTRFMRRSLLYVPGSSPKMLEKALAFTEADGIILDLEDSVSPSEKANARALVCGALQKTANRAGRREIIVRLNPLASPFAFDDFAAVCPLAPDSLIITKASANTLVCADMLVAMLENKHGLPPGEIRLIPLIETAEGIEDITAILRASSRITAAQFGAEDFTRDMEVERTLESGEIAYARNRLAVACRAAGVDCLDTPYADFRDREGCERDTRYAKSIGMTGRTVIHPSLAGLTNRIFSPSPEEITRAEHIVRAFEEATDKGLGAVALDGKMIDAPVVDRARNLLKKAAGTGEGA